ncbi:ATP-binding protein [Nocardioides litoris]|uniref:ATP-binding protein n=1 Tax=Nocardioides litoris TaxID=1926648 RepID=UPI001124C6A4|nr:LuxR family transcriptional regulator [Nocardioides litoris]
MPRLVGRTALLAEVAGLLGRGESVALCGPTGVGKSALLDAVEREARSRGSEVLRATGSAEETGLPFAALRDLLAQCPDDLVAAMPEPVRDLVVSGLVGDDAAHERRSELAAAVHGLLERWSADRPVLLLLDDVQWLDGESSAIVGYARRRLRGSVLVVATVGVAASDLAAGVARPDGTDDDIDVSELVHLDVPPLAAIDMLDLLCAHGLTPDLAQRVHVESGGVPALALAVAGMLGERPSVLGERVPLPASTERVLQDRFRGLPPEVRETLLHAALLHRPTVRDLERSGRVGADDDVRLALRSGLLARDGAVLRFTPSALRDVVVESFPASARAALHERLADAAPGAAERLRHLALADPRPDADLAHELGRAARDSAAAGGRELAAELYLLAADRAPFALAPERVEWLVCAVETAAPGNHVDLVQRALLDVRDGQTTPAQAVRVRLAIPELAGHDVTLLDEVLTAALADAGDDDLLVAKVLLQRARIALMEARPHAAHRACERAVRLLERHGDDDELALGLTTLAVAQRWTGADGQASLDRALALAGPTPTGFVHTSPEYMQARFAFYDDRLDEAWSAHLAMLAQVERGAGMDHLHVLRCLVEVAARAGRGREAVEYAARAARTGEQFDLEAYSGWFVAATAELLAGDVGRARTLAGRGAEAAAVRGDVRYRQRHLVLLGQALLRSGDAQGAADALERVRAHERAEGFSDPTVSRWHADLVSALAALGRLDDADDVLAEARREVARREAAGGTDGVSAQLDRAEAELRTARGDLDGAAHTLDRAAKVAADLGLRVDEGRVLVTRAHLERRRRRVAAARTALQDAHRLFTTLHATAWADQVQAELTPDPARGAGDPLLDRLTETEARIARAVAEGASNREIAERTYVSVKTVEATLTRIYRKLDLRSRTQLATLLVPQPPE